MEKFVVEVAENVFNDIPGYPYRRRTLPEKIIRLRKMSQDCHVRRMKAALRNKQMQAMQGTSNLSLSFSSCSTSSVNRINSSPSGTINYRNKDNYYDEDKNENSSSNVSNFSSKINNNRKKDCHSPFTNVNRYKKTDNFSAENNTVMSDTALDMCCRKKSMIHPNCKINKMFNSTANNDKPDKTPDVRDGRKIYDKNEVKKDKNQTSSDASLKGNTSSKGSWRPFDNIMDSIHLNRLKMKKEKDYEESLNRSLENFHLRDEKNTEIGTKGLNISKIPILQSRLSSGKKNNTKKSLQMVSFRKSSVKNTENILHSSKVSNAKDSIENSQAIISKEISKSTPEISSKECILQGLECNPEKNSRDASGFSSKGEEVSNALHSVSKWLQDSVVKAEKINENSNVSQAKSLVVDVERSMENLSLKSSTTPKTKVFKTASSLTYSVKDSCSGSDESFDYYYETETGDEVVKSVTNRSDEDQNAWEEDSDDVSALLPADIEDKIFSTPKNYAKNYFDAPDYPKTPYDLRYPRYYRKENNDMVEKVEVHSTQLKTPKKKIRKKSRNLTPKVKKGKKAKSNISCKLHASKNKKA